LGSLETEFVLFLNTLKLGYTKNSESEVEFDWRVNHGWNCNH